MKTKAGRFVKKIAAVVLAFTMACPYAYAADIGKVTYVEGRVDISKSGSEVATPLREGDGIAIGDSIRTKSNSKAEVTFNDNSALRLAQNTKVEVRDYVLDEKNQRKTAEVMVDRGKARTIISKMPGLTEFNISTPNAKGTVHGSDVYTTFQAGSSNMLVADGQLSVTNPSIPKEVLIVPAGNSVVVPQNEAPKGPRAYFDLEKKMSEDDTSIPDMASRRPTSTVIKGAIAKLSGDVKITLKSTGQTRKATINDIIEEGDSIETGANGMVELKFDNGNGLNLKPSTKVTVTKLAQDPKTGQYENKFESSMGKVRARIEKVKETKSTFEVRTPTAICGARGTLMYIEIGPKTTKCFFEGGWGDLASAISSMHREIEMGHAAYSDNDGNISEQYIPGDEERLEWTSNWGPGNGTEGYVSPGGTIGLGLNAGAITNVVLNPETELQSYFSDPLFPVTPVGTVTEEIPTSSGLFHADSSYYGNGNGMMDGIVSLFDYLWNGGTATIESAGTYENYGYSPFVWFGEYNYEQYAIVEGATVSEGFLYSYNPDTQMYTTYDGGAFYGNAVGIGGGGIMDGIVRFLYIDPSGNAGIAKGLVEGLYGLGAYIMVGVLTGEQKAADIEILAEELYNSIFITDYDDGALYGVANSGGASTGAISGNDRFNTFSIVNHETGVAQNWGIYQHIFSGSSYSGDLSSGWTGYVGGNDAIGAYFRPYEGAASGRFYQDSGYWLMNISDGTWSDSNFTASASGYFITMTKMGTISGDLIGVYNDEGSWQGAGMGEWQGTPLKFASQVYDSMCYPQVSASGYRNYYNGDTYTGQYNYYWNDHNYHRNGNYIAQTYYSDDVTQTYVYTYFYGNNTYRRDTYGIVDGYWTQLSQEYGRWDDGDIQSMIFTSPTGDTQFEDEYLSASRQHNGHMSGILGGTDSLWSGAEAAAVFMGRYSDCSNYNTTKGAWTSYIQTENRINGGYTDYEGGAYSGLFASAHLGSRAIGVLKAFYVDQGGAAGILSGDFTGTHYPEINMVMLDGTITRDERFPDGIGIDPQDLHNNVSEGGGGGTLISNSSNDWIIRADEALDTMSLVDYDNGVAADWGIYAQNFTGYYNGAVPQGWSAVMGGNDSFGITDPYDYGEYSNYSYNDGQYYYQSDNGYWIADISDGTWAGGDLSANLNGRYISRTRLGTMSGIIRGIYDEFGNNGSWVGVGAGEWEGQDLSWVSNLGVSRNYYFGNYNNALMGSIEDLWSGMPHVVGMGDLNNHSSTYRIWGSDNVYTHDYKKDTDTAYSGGAFYGLLRGIVLDDESLNGLFRAIYVDQSGNGGVIKGFIDDGAMYQDLSMFEFSGVITDRIQKISAELLGIAPEDLIDYVKLGNNESGNLYAVSEDGSYISGSDNFRTMSIADYDQNVAQNWGIYGQTLSGSYGLALLSEAVYGDGGELITPAIYGNLNSWSGHMGGNDSFGVYNPTKQYDGYAYGTDSGYWVATVETDPEWTGENTFHAGLNGRFLTYTKTGTLNGEILGRYLGDGTWQGVGAGDWEGTALSHVAVIDVDHDRLTYEYIPHSWWYGYAYNYYWDWVHHYTYIDALIGGVDTLWSGDPKLTMMGQMYGEKPYPFVWQDKDVYSHNYLLDNGYSNRANTTYDGGSYFGNLIGSFAGNAAKAVFAALYIDPSGNAGSFLVNLAGTIYRNISSYDYFEMDSTSFYRSENSYATDILPGNLRDNLYTTSEGEGTLSGVFVGEDGPSGYINGSDTFVTTTFASEDLGIAIPVGIYHQEISGSLHDPEGAGDFEAMMGGNDPIGAYLSRYTHEDEFGQTVEEFDLQDDWGYWMADIDGALNSDGTLEAGLTGKFISHTKLGELFGKILGVYSGSSWSGNGVGIWGGQELDFASDVNIYIDGYQTGAILGGVDTLWQETPGSMTMLGGMQANSESNVHSWKTYDAVKSHDFRTGADTTYGENPGAYYGFMGGLLTGTELRGKFLAFYIDPDGNAGVLKSELAGTYYPAINMFEMLSGAISKILPHTGIGISAEDLSASVDSLGGRGQITGAAAFGDPASYIIGSDSLTTYYLVNKSTYMPQDWGVYTQNFSGDYYDPAGLKSFSAKISGYDPFGARRNESYGSPSWYDFGYWLADMSGTFNDNNTIDGSLSGHFITLLKMGHISGDILGTYRSSDRLWDGFGIGTWDSDPLSFASGTTLYFGYNGPCDVIMGGVNSLWSTETSPTITIMGRDSDFATYSVPDRPAQTWRSDRAIMSHDYVSNTNMTSDGGAYYGIMGGVESNGALRGNFAAIYIDPSGNAGILWSDLNGSSYIASGMMAMLEQTVSIGEPLAEGLGYLTDDMENYVYSTGGAGMLVGSFGDPESYINANESLTTYAIADLEGGVAEKWGIYLQTLNGDYCDAAEVGSFNAKMGGNDSFGMVTWSDGLPYDEGYWLADVDGTLNGDNTIDAVLEGLFITKSKMGTMSGDIFGYGNAAPGEAGYWNGVGVGAWQGSPLSFFSDFQLYLNNDETSYEAYAGGINSLWSTVVAPTITLIAMADEAWYGGSTPQLWFSGEEAVHSEDYVNDTSMTSDLGAYYGVMGGVESNREIRGVFAALYIDPDGNAGVLWSDLQGGVYPEIGMIGMIDQVITKTPIYEGADLDPSELVIFGTRGTGLISGTFGGMGFINGSDELNAYAIIDQNGSGTLPWGLYTQNIGGSYSNSSTSNLFGAVMGGYDPFGMISVFGTGNTQDNSYWIMNVSGSLNQDYTIDGSVSNGVFLGRTTMGTFLRGDIMGVYYPDSPGATTGYWEGLGVGVWQKSPLSFFSEQSIYYGATESTFNAYIGGVTSLWSSNAANLPSITVIAACNTDGTTQLWSADGAIYSFNYQNGTNTTYDNGAYYGYMGGYASGGSARGMFAALYIDPAGKAGILWSDLSGSLYSSIGMLAMLNNFVENPIFAPGGTGVAASDLLASVSRNESLSQAVLSGAFKTGGSITGNAYFEADSIVDNINKVAQGWGLYTLDVSGTYTGSSITYSTLIGGNNEFGFYYSGPTDSKTINSDSGYWIGNIEGSVNPNNTLDGILSGKFLTHTLLGTLEGAIMGIVHPDSLVPTNGTIEALGLGAWDGDALSYVSDIQTQVKSFAVTATTVRYDASYHIYGNSGNGNNKLTRDVDYYYYSDNSLGYKKDFQYTYNGQGRQSMSNGSYERTYNANGTWTGQYWQGNSWNTNSGTWNGTLSGTIETNLPTPDSNDVFTSSQTGGWALSITNTGNSFITGLAGGVSDIVWGQTSQMTIMGTVSSSFAAGNVWSADIKSHNYINGTDTTYDGGAYMGYLLGAKPGTPDGLFVALYVDPSQKGGYLLGKISGELYPGLGMFEATGDILATKMSDNVGILPVDLTALGSTSSDTMTWQGSGKFAQGGSLVTMASGQTLQINNQDWGIWTAFIGGNYTYPTGGITSQDWSTALSGESASGAHIIGTASGNIWADHKVEGTFNGIYVAPGQTAGSVSIGKVEGLVDGGYIEVDAVSGTWNAASAGEWVEVSDLLDQTKMFGANGIAELNKFVNVPVTEVYRNLLTSTACAGGITSATMNLNLYALDPNVLSGIWTALINGGYSGTVNPTGWSATVSGNGGATNVTVAGTQWANNQWVADVTGTVNVNGSTVNITNGQAGGTYTNPDVNGAGTFTGAGAGTYQAP